MSAIPNLPGYRSNKGVPNRRPKKDTGVKRQIINFHQLELSAPKAPAATIPVLPGVLENDGVVYRYFAFFKEAVNESNDESFRVRKVNILYYLSNQEIQIVESKQENSGIPQGTFLRRCKITKPDGANLTSNDLEVGSEVTIYGRSFRIVGCDDHTRASLASQGINVKDNEGYPSDPYTNKRDDFMRRETGAATDVYRGVRKNPITEHLEARLGNASGNNKNLGQFLEKNRKVLRFDAYWDDTARYAGKLRFFKVHYYLENDTVEIKEVFERNSGFDKMSKLLERNKLKRPDQTDVSEKDLYIGAELQVFGRKFVLIDADNFTRGYYASTPNLKPLGAKIVKERPKVVYAKETQPPPHTGFGSELDSRKSWESLHPKPPKKDLEKMMKYDGKILTFEARLCDTPKRKVSMNDQIRKFNFLYFLADDTMQIFEPPQRNSGIIGGKFLERGQHINKETNEFFTQDDLKVNSTVFICGRAFLITKKAGGPTSSDAFSRSNIKNIITKLENKLRRHSNTLARTFRALDEDKNGYVTFDELKVFLNSYFAENELSEVDTYIIMRYFDRDGEGRIDYNEFAEKILGKDVGQNNYTTSSSADGGDTMAGDDDFSFSAADIEAYQQIAIRAAEQEKEKQYLSRSILKFQQRLIETRRNELDQAFRNADSTFSGRITKDSFQAILTQPSSGGSWSLKMQAKPAAVVTNHIWKVLGLEQTDTLSRQNYIQVIDGNLNI